jgi:4-aminobutyrate aminotransferase-like enzyme
MGKPIGNGHPMSAVVTTREIADSFNNGMEYFNTFAGSPVSCAVGLSVLDVIERDNLKLNALTVGNYLLDGFRKLQQRYDAIGDVRWVGSFSRDRTCHGPQNESSSHGAGQESSRWCQGARYFDRY